MWKNQEYLAGWKSRNEMKFHYMHVVTNNFFLM